MPPRVDGSPPTRYRKSQRRFPAIAKYSHESYLSQKDNLRAASKRYHQRHKDVLNERRRAFYIANRERLREKQRQYNSDNKLLRRTLAKLDAQRHFFRIRANNLTSKHEGETASRIDIARLWHQQKGICPLTGVRLNKHNAQLDHIIPVIRGGIGTIENLRWVLRDANYAKRDLTDEQFFALCLKVVSNRKERT